LRRHGFDSEGGFSLAEILVTIVIVGVVFTAILNELLVSITVSALNRKQATADTLARSAAEWIKNSVQTHYLPCAGAPNPTYTFTGLPLSPDASGYSVQLGTNGSSGVEYWNGATIPPGASPVFVSTCPPPPKTADQGLQRITISVTSPDGQATESVQVLKRATT
jgi:prepilin-type N-terminal cleavage/methylation domain-containing protein